MALVFVTSEAGAQAPWYTVGPKVGYTVGQGFTLGVELSYFPAGQNPYDDPTLHGYTLDLYHVSNGSTSIHVGAEWMFFAGIDVGPTLVLDSAGVHAGGSAIAFATLGVVPYYEITVVKGRRTAYGFGGYLKFPIGLPPSHPWN